MRQGIYWSFRVLQGRLARIKIDEDEINHLKAKITLYPGMPAQAFIITGTRSLFKYLFDPITEASYKAFRED